MYERLLNAVADDFEAGGASRELLAGYDLDAFGGAGAIRLMGSVHRLVLSGATSELAVYYPSAGGAWEPERGSRAFRDVVHERPDEVRAGLQRPPQTNEVGRSTTLLGGLLHVMDVTGLPIRLLEIGASGGLNLRVDRFRFELAPGVAVGPGGSPVTFARPWLDGDWPAVRPRVDIVERRGCDPDPVDPLTEDGQLTLLSYVWPDQTERIERLRGAFAAARMASAEVERTPGSAFLDGLEPEDGVTTVVWHSVMWQYLDDDERETMQSHVTTAAAAASPSAPVAHLSLEPRPPTPGHRPRFLVTLRLWPPGTQRILGYAAPHGIPVRWLADPPPTELPAL